jgi:NAD(P)-dependent dehydrogenase (short-subunit alcohol dehydrogenase family)
MSLKVVDINLMGVCYGLRNVIPVMQQNGYGRIVNVASIGGIRGVMNQTAYVVTKHAVAGITKNAALEYRRSGLTMNAIAIVRRKTKVVLQHNPSLRMHTGVALTHDL